MRKGKSPLELYKEGIKGLCQKAGKGNETGRRRSAVRKGGTAA